MPEPRSDWCCLSRKCATDDGEAPIFEASTKATHCPECGSKRIRRIYSAQVSTKGIAKFVEPLVLAAGWQQQKDTYEAAKAARIANGKMRPGDAVIHGPASTIGQMMGKVHPAFAGVGVQTNRSATVEGVGLGRPLPRGNPPEFIPPTKQVSTTFTKVRPGR